MVKGTSAGTLARIQLIARPVPVKSGALQRAERRFAVHNRLRSLRVIAQARMTATRAGWLPTGYMQHRRYLHTAALLQDGRVLVAGGHNGTNAIQFAEIYDPDTARWTRAAPMLNPRYAHTATLLNDGSVLVCGGAGAFGVTAGSGGSTSGDSLPLAAVERYSPVTGTWTVMEPMNQTHVNHTATLLPDGRVLIADGLGLFDGDEETLNVVEWFDPATGSWTTGNAGHPRFSASATLLPDGRILLYGGETFSRETGLIPQFSADLLDPATGNTDRVAEGARFWHTATLLPDGTVLLAGGGIASSYITSPENVTTWFENTREERFIPATGQRQVTTPMSIHRHGHTATLLPDGTVMIAGGNFYVETQTPYLQLPAQDSLVSTERYQPLPVGPDGSASGRWSNEANLLEARGAHTATLLQGGTVLVAGGGNYSTGEVFDSAERFYPNLPGLGGCLVPLAAGAAVAGGGLLARRLLRGRRGGSPDRDTQPG